MDSIIQGISRETEKRRRKTNRGRRSVMEEVYGGAQYLRKERRLRKCKGSIRGIRRKNKGRSKEAGEDKYSRRKRL